MYTSRILANTTHLPNVWPMLAHRAKPKRSTKWQIRPFNSRKTRCCLSLNVEPNMCDVNQTLGWRWDIVSETWISIPADTRRWINVGLTLAHRRDQHWFNVLCLLGCVILWPGCHFSSLHIIQVKRVSASHHQAWSPRISCVMDTTDIDTMEPPNWSGSVLSSHPVGPAKYTRFAPRIIL